MYREDMIGDGIENCIQYIHNFDPDKSSNPFAYFTQIVYYAYLRRIAKEKRQQAIREKILERKGFEEVFHTDDLDNMSDMNYIKSRVETNTRYS
jgi:DNA-directed RNA polymerase specialized sigma24 family protein|tara:strand:+ start:1445 stop:1726 length:282 start_codon:yes stop_codon:yes gene_type:complete